MPKPSQNLKKHSVPITLLGVDPNDSPDATEANTFVKRTNRYILVVKFKAMLVLKFCFVLDYKTMLTITLRFFRSSTCMRYSTPLSHD